MKTEWLDRTMMALPLCYALCGTREMFEDALRHLKVPFHGAPSFMKTERGNATTHFYMYQKMQCAVVTCDIATRLDRNPIENMGLMVHEAVHIVQHAMGMIGEEKPSEEFQAYAIQWIAQQLLASFAKQAKVLRGSKSSRKRTAHL